MSAKEYLSQAYRLDQRIHSKLEQIAALNDLATKCTSTLTGMPGNPNHATSAMADTVTKIVDLQAEINRDIDRLVDLKREIVATVTAVENANYQTVLEKRYLCFLSWEQIAMDMRCSVDNVFKLHKKALEFVADPKSLQ